MDPEQTQKRTRSRTVEALVEARPSAKVDAVHAMVICPAVFRFSKEPGSKVDHTEILESQLLILS